MRTLIAETQCGNEASRQRLVEANLRLVAAIVRRFSGYVGDRDDLFQTGVIGLMKAIAGFDLNYDVTLSTYAVPYIIGEIKRFLRTDQPVKISRSLHEVQRRVLQIRDQLEQNLGRSPTPQEVAEAANLPKDQVLAATQSAAPVVSLDEPLSADGDGSGTRMDRIVAGDDEADVTERLTLRRALRQLPSEEQRVILLRYVYHLSQVETAARLACSQSRVSRLEQRARHRLKYMLRP